MKNVVLLLILSLVVSCDEHKQHQETRGAESEIPNIMATEESKSKESIVLMGNSITEGWAAFRPEFFVDRPFINKGISGQTTPQLLARFQRDVIDLQPKAVIILAGINDIAENTGPIPIPDIAQNIFTMVELATENQIQVILCSTLPADDFPWRLGLNPQLKVPQLNALLRDYAKDHGILFIDYFSAMADTDNGLLDELGYDGVHPNAAGYAVMEPLLEEALVLLQIK